MVITEISAALTTIKVAKDLIKGISSLNADVAIKEKTVDLLGTIVDLQEHILSMQSKYGELLKSKSDLEEKLKQHEEWLITKSGYTLNEVATGVFVYCSKESKDATEPKHWLCANCFSNEKKSILQLSKYDGSGQHYSCPGCKTDIYIPSDEVRRAFGQNNRDFIS
jgi:hypothetical protein